MTDGGECKFGCTGDNVAVHYGWFHCTPESRAVLAKERAKLAADELTAETERLDLYDDDPFVSDSYLRYNNPT